MAKDTAQAFESYFLDEQTTVDFKLPNNKPMLHDGAQVKATVWGPASDVYAKARAELDAVTQGRTFARIRGEEVSDDDSEAEIKFLTACIASLDNFPFPGGVPALLREKRLCYMVDQIRAKLGNQANFYKGEKP